MCVMCVKRLKLSPLSTQNSDCMYVDIFGINQVDTVDSCGRLHLCDVREVLQIE